ncbi:transcriptional regulator, AraC family protein [Pedobacter sp. BAL39]|uniref:helix-turn-helix domain-containing protein n=1 Tax=Pedobacter sp. BAL39 TaxID=391596 RepID=UPI0001559209|nr:response regulator transcription factor [Pedobacter sp. BAL39]EDM36112.1 transcriptional regulator, AraC family protein [Pedobacter sp. BAL39]
MKKTNHLPLTVQSISELHRILHIPEPQHPMVSIVDFNKIDYDDQVFAGGFLLNFFMICIKKDFKGKIKYGQNYLDFDEGVLSFIAPGQLCYRSVADDKALEGYMLLFHPDFLRGYPIAKSIKNYEFFSYSVTEALYLSKKEEGMIEGVLHHIEEEYHSTIDPFSQDVIISHIEVLLNYANRFYNRQFITRKVMHHDLLVKMEDLLSEYFEGSLLQEKGLPTVQYVSEQLNVSPNYLSAMLRSLTGMNTQQHIHNKLIEKAKEILSTTTLSVSEVAYQLGFEYPQSFNKLFKNKTNISPLKFRTMFS